MNKAKTSLYVQIAFSALICSLVSLFICKRGIEIMLIGISLQLSFAGVIFFVYTLFLRTKLSENSFSYVNELINDKFLLASFFFYFITLFTNSIIALLNTADFINLFWFKFSYIFFNLFSLCLVFAIYIFLIQLISPVKLALFLIAKLSVKRVIKYQLGLLSETNTGLRITRNIYSAPVRDEDPLVALHEVLMVPIKNYDYRSVGSILNSLLSHATQPRLFVSSKKNLLFSYHLFDYTVSLQKNLTNPKMYNWNSKSFISHFVYVYLLTIQKYEKTADAIILALLKASLAYILHYYATNFSFEFNRFSFSNHLQLISQLHSKNDTQMEAIKDILTNKNGTSFLLNVMKGTSINNLQHPWDFNRTVRWKTH